MNVSQIICYAQLTLKSKILQNTALAEFLMPKFESQKTKNWVGPQWSEKKLEKKIHRRGRARRHKSPEKQMRVAAQLISSMSIRVAFIFSNPLDTWLDIFFFCVCLYSFRLVSYHNHPGHSRLMTKKDISENYATAFLISHIIETVNRTTVLVGVL